MMSQSRRERCDGQGGVADAAGRKDGRAGDVEILNFVDTASRIDQSSQAVHFARDVSDRAIVMEKGRIVEDGEPSTIFRNPSSDRTRAFLRAVIER